MKDIIVIGDAADHTGKSVTVRGWMYNKRSSGGLVFMHMRDGTGFMQATAVKDSLPPEAFELIQGSMLESSFALTGTVRAEPRAPGGYELQVTGVVPIHLVTEEFPIGKKEHGPDFLLSHRHLWIRSRRQWAILRLRSMMMRAICDFLDRERFIRFDAPIITPTASEGTTTLFELDYFGEKAYLTQSGQLYLEAAIASLGRAYDFGPIMRAEKSKTRRHLIEFWMMDAEAAFVDFRENMDIQEAMVKYVLRYLLDHAKTELSMLDRDVGPLEKAVSEPFVRLTYTEAVEKLHELGSDIKAGEDFGNDDETMLMNHYDVPVFVSHFPIGFKAFYFKRDQTGKFVLGADLLAPEGYGEVIGGGEREADYQTILSRIDEHGYKRGDYDWYLDLRKFGSVPHSGFGIGLERLVAWVCKLEHVRETIPFPRLLERFRP
jgi:asparaginyl-tRNA synthetase